MERATRWVFLWVFLSVGAVCVRIFAKKVDKNLNFMVYFLQTVGAVSNRAYRAGSASVLMENAIVLKLWGSRVVSQIYRRVMDMRNARINLRDEKAISFHAHLVGIARGLFARLRAVGCFAGCFAGCFNSRLGRITPPITLRPLRNIHCKAASGFPVALSSCPHARCCVAGYFHSPRSLPRPITYKSLK